MDAANLYMLSVDHCFLGATSFPWIVGVMPRVVYVLLHSFSEKCLDVVEQDVAAMTNAPLSIQPWDCVHGRHVV